MKKQFTKALKNALEIQAIAVKEPINFTEDDLDILAEAIETLNKVYEELYDKVFVEV